MVLRNLTNTLRTVTAGVGDRRGPGRRHGDRIMTRMTIQVALPLRLISGLGDRASD